MDFGPSHLILFSFPFSMTLLCKNKLLWNLSLVVYDFINDVNLRLHATVNGHSMGLNESNWRL